MSSAPALLPNSASLLVVDRFSLLDSDFDDGLVRFWDLVVAIISTPASSIPRLIDQLETIAITLRDTASTDFGFLSAFLSQWPSSRKFFSHTWPAIVTLALELPTLFPDGELVTLTGSNPEVSLSRRQAACLVIHQFLCSIPVQPWATGDSASPDFHIWYSSEQPHPRVVDAYLTALFTYFERVADSIPPHSQEECLLESNNEWPVTFTLHSLRNDLKDILFDDTFLSDCSFKTLGVVRLFDASTAPSVLGLPDGAAVISANKNVGFGRSGTQEETHVGSSPEACLAVLLTPTLKPAEVMIVRGAEAMISIVGYGRDACLGEVLPKQSSETHRNLWSKRTMLFMDALELDEYDPDGVLPDLLPGHIDRELQKSYTAFSSFPYTSVFTGLWGCRTFAGNPQIKTTVQWCAASLAGVSLKFVCSANQEDFGESLEKFVKTAIDEKWKVGWVLAVLRGLDAGHSEARSVFRYISERIKEEKG